VLQVRRGRRILVDQPNLYWYVPIYTHMPVCDYTYLYRIYTVYPSTICIIEYALYVIYIYNCNRVKRYILV